MSDLSKLNFMALDINGKNYLSWILDAKVHLSAASLGNTFVLGNNESSEDRSKALIFICHHLDEALKSRYFTVKNPYTLWIELKDRFDHQKTVILPRARYEWMHIRLQYFKSVSAYNSTLFQIVSRLKLCGETMKDSDLPEKTYSTFHASNILLQQQYRERNFTKYSELISCLLVAEQNNELLLRNHQNRPTGSAPAPEVNDTVSESRGKKHGHWLGPKHFNYKKKGGHYSHHHKGKKNNIFPKPKGKNSENYSKKHNESICRRCGSLGHWEKVSRMPNHLVDLYKAFIQAKGNNAETNFAKYEVPIDLAYLDLNDHMVEENNNKFDDIESFFNDV
ncbi:uncharacterized protein LOC113343155 [Papaver somniferum]|uniref:uncharacterized protein LOC113343155 n=1 Tax=Papaver somniferum TaxID=3469 RepID=UPI000E6FC16C|nr:uncharacterized protein LOC113343155 [Papaver somniferum]